MQKVLFSLVVMFVTALIVLVIIFGLTPTGREIWKEYKNRDSITAEQRKITEAVARDLIAEWAKEAEAYKNGDESAKERANDAADTYNRYMMTNSYVFGETLPEGIYAVIEKIED